VSLLCSFCVGGTGDVYEGRGWDIQGAHAPRYNNRSTGICFIGDYMREYWLLNVLSVLTVLTVLTVLSVLTY